MKTSLNVKLALALIAVAVLTGLVLSLVFRSNYANRFDQFVLDQQSATALELLTQYYTENGSWQGIEEVLNQSGYAATHGDATAGKGRGQGGNNTGNNPVTGQPMAGMMAGMGRRLFGLANADGVLLVSAVESEAVGTKLSAAEVSRGVPIVVDGQAVGTLLMADKVTVYNAAEQVFIQKTNASILVAMLAAIALAGLIGVLFARTLTKPLRTLTTATQRMAEGRPHEAVEVKTGDELQELAEAFNHLSEKAERSDRLRKQMTADIAHDLRTPMTVLAGYMESMRDGDLQPTPERFDLMLGEIDHLTDMVADLKLLSQSDAGELKLEKQALDPGSLCAEAVSLFEFQAKKKGVRLACEVLPGTRQLSGDYARLLRVLQNLLANALRYTPAGGEVKVTCGPAGVADRCAGENWTRVEVRDSGSGIAAEDLPLIFERFQRGDPSRHMDESQSGLGLAIVKALVEAHGGKARAESTAGEGTRIILCLPNA